MKRDKFKVGNPVKGMPTYHFNMNGKPVGYSGGYQSDAINLGQLVIAIVAIPLIILFYPIFAFYKLANPNEGVYPGREYKFAYLFGIAMWVLSFISIALG